MYLVQSVGPSLIIIISDSANQSIYYYGLLRHTMKISGQQHVPIRMGPRSLLLLNWADMGISPSPSSEAPRAITIKPPEVVFHTLTCWARQTTTTGRLFFLDQQPQ